MTDRVLCVDDEPAVLAGYQRALRKHYSIDIAVGGDEGLKNLRERGPFAVVVADMHMPGMDGTRFLALAKDAAPDTVRMMVTGANDQSTAVQAINEGSIFRFLTKPCTPDVLARAIDACGRQHHLIAGERELLEKTLSGSIRILTEILSLADPAAFGRVAALRSDLRAVASALGAENPWEIEIAAMLAPIGNVTVPPMVALKAKAGHALSTIEQDMLARVPQVGSQLLANIPRLEAVSRLVLYQHKRFDGGGLPDDGLSGTAIPLGARILRVLLDLGHQENSGKSRVQALTALGERRGWYDPAVLAAIGARIPPAERPATPLPFSALRAGMMLREKITTADGQVLISAGHVVTPTMLERLGNFARLRVLAEPILVDDLGLQPAT